MWETKQLQVLSDFHILYVNLGLGDMSKNSYLRFFFDWFEVCGMYISVLCIWIKQIKWM